MPEHPITGPNRYTLEDRHNPAIPKSSIMAAIEALGLAEDSKDIGTITITPEQVTVEYYERREDGAVATRHHQHGMSINYHTVTLDVDKEK